MDDLNYMTTADKIMFFMLFIPIIVIIIVEVFL